MREQRFFKYCPELRAAPSNSSDSIGTLVGYAAKFNSLSEDLGGFREKIQAGAFSNSLRRGDDVRALINHDPSLLIGRSTNGSLVLREDATGLRIAVALPNTSYARDLLESVRRQDTSQMSFAFRVPDGGESWSDGFDDDGNACSVRTLNNVDLSDVSFVTFPAYQDTTASADDRLNPAQVLGRSLWPQEIPVEVRSHVPGITNRSVTDSVSRRRSLVNRVLGI